MTSGYYKTVKDLTCQKGKKRQQEFYNETIFWKQRNVNISPNKSEEKSLLAGMPIKTTKENPSDQLTQIHRKE